MLTQWISVNQNLLHNLRYTKCKLLNGIKFALVLPMFQLIQQPLSRIIYGKKVLIFALKLVSTGI